VTRASVRVIPLGGVGEIGKNATVIETKTDLLLIDAGVKFPEEEMLGVDLVIPDFSYVLDNLHRLRGILLTHSHEDHTGAIPYLLQQAGRRLPIFGSRLTLGLLREKLREQKVEHLAALEEVTAGERRRFGVFEVEFMGVSHSVPDSLALIIRTPIGVFFHTGDWKFDDTPIQGYVTDVEHLRALGDAGVLALMSDCVRVEVPGRTPSERVVAEALATIFASAPGRILVSTFASNVTRLVEVIQLAHQHGRKVAAVGRAMEQTIRVAGELGYLPPLPGVLVDLDQIRRLPPRQVALLVSGSQGEPTSALARIAANDHPVIRLRKDDTVVLSATPIPGNEETVGQTIDNLFRRGARVIYRAVMENVHVSGHASRDELRYLIELLRPRFCLPLHGEYRMMVLYRDLAATAGVPPERTCLAEIGEVVEFTPQSVRKVGRVKAGAVLVDGLTVGRVTHVVLRDRRRLAEEGIIIAAVAVDRETGRVVGGPELAARGFVHADLEGLLERAKREILKTLNGRRPRGEAEYGYLVGKIKESLGRLIFSETRRHPLILPLVTEV